MEDIELGELRLAPADLGNSHWLGVFDVSGCLSNIKLPFNFIVEEILEDDLVKILTSTQGIVFVSKLWVVNQTTRL